MNARGGTGTEGAPRGGGRRGLGAAGMGAALTLGWCLHDLVLFTTRGWPWEALRLFPWPLAVVLAGALAAALLARYRWLVAVATAACLGALFAPSAVREPLAELVGAPRLRLAPTALLLLLATGTALHLLGAPRGRGPSAAPLPLTLAAGALAAILFRALHTGLDAVSAWVGLATLGLLVAACVPRTNARRLLVALALSAPLPWYVERQVWFLSPGRPALGPPPRAADPEAPNLLLVILDTLRADRLASHGYARATMPWLDAFARETATLYPDARATSSWTLPSHASLFTGLLPAEHGATHARSAQDEQALERRGLLAYPLAPEATTLAERLRARGYHTGAILANASTLRVELGLEQGFRDYDVRPACFVGADHALVQLLGAPLWIGHKPYRDARTITDLALAWLAERPPGPYFLALNYMEPHWPYLPPAPFDEAWAAAADEEDPLSLAYDRELLFLDRELERLFMLADTRTWLENTLIVITSDHGEALGERGMQKHDWTLYEELLRVPLLVVPPGGRRRVVDGRAIAGHEVHDLMLTELGLDPAPAARSAAPPASEWYHDSRLPAPAPFVGASGQRDLAAWIDGGRKWIVSSRGEVELYELGSDPRERTPLALGPAEAAELRRRAQAWWDAHPAPDPARTPVHRKSAFDGTIDERLRELGYVGED